MLLTSPRRNRNRSRVKPCKALTTTRTSTTRQDPKASVSDPTNPAASFAISNPSSVQDLLKYIHYFASQYVHAKGQLFDVSRIARREEKEKERRVARAQAEEEGEEETNANSESESGEEAESERSKGKGKRRRAGKFSTSTPRPDMFRAFDGSALYAIGVLMQELIASTVIRSYPHLLKGEGEGVGVMGVNRAKLKFETDLDEDGEDEDEEEKDEEDGEMSVEEDE